ncbi:cupin domain-containing protein [Paenibacillus sp. J22TS3]|uniref:cupin domain-containing protein n=1 Tax=Paenibacillus sp. J22TS3 TaxID=2807192 RepID=UPI001B00C373|nr:cupin domain-containing protein [Paenibacillus sp. J22TS3]GIP23205.1 hypothetical protein J22TS3_34800 [Paenibacillus sp. J22TS3]
MEKKMLVDYTEFREDSFTKKVLFKQEDSVVFTLHFNPGQSLPSHKHPGTDVFILVLDGSGQVTVDGNQVAMAKGDVIRVEGDESFSFTNISSEKTSLYVVLTKLPDERYAQNV